MKFIADFHIHSKYSHATSKFMDLLSISTWGQFKGIGVMGTGDFTHPQWQKELKLHLEQKEAGLFVLKNEYQAVVDSKVYETCKGLQRFILSTEISVVFKRNGRCYRVHVLILAPSFEVVDAITKSLAQIGNIQSDGRPILGCDIKTLVKVVLNASVDCMIIPAHVWTPWYGLLGSKSGFDSFYDSFEELHEYVYAFEKGLSSSLLMNAQLSELDRYAILCNSDAHSVQKLGREANIMDTDLSYEGITDALQVVGHKGLVAGIEFFPERGKYYGDGHRACHVYLTPEQTREQKEICSECKRPITVGVLNRVNQLADRTEDQALEFVRKRYRVVPLLDILCQELNVAEANSKVSVLYQQMIKNIGPEFFVLLKASMSEIEKFSTKGVARAIDKLRRGDIIVTPGYDGTYGVVQF